MKLCHSRIKTLRSTAQLGMVVGIVFVVFSVFIFLIGFVPSAEGKRNAELITYGIMFVPMGILVYRKTKEFSTYPILCDQYFNILKNYSDISIIELASLVKEDPKKVRMHIRLIIHDRYIEGIRYVHDTDCIVIDSQTQTNSIPQLQYIQQSKPQNGKQITRVSVTCESCCGITLLPVDSVGVCDYCGSKIKS